VHKQTYRDQLWYVLQDSCSEKYFRVQQTAYEFLARLNPHKTVEAVWLDFCASHPDEAPTQGEVMALLSQLHQSNLLFFRSPGEYEGIFERHRKVKRREKLTHLLAFLYFRIPVWNPDRMLKAHISWMRYVFSVPAFVIWCFAVLLGARAVLGNVPLFLDQTPGVLAADNLIWLFLAMFVLKFFHEMGHAIVCRKYGGSVHTIGIMFIALMPLPYTDASSSWSLRNKWQRSMVAAAGMYVELFFAALAAVIWSQTAPGVVKKTTLPCEGISKKGAQR
jgi:putative peptide zinc metalloprotease protein